MKKILALLLIGILMSGCASNKYTKVTIDTNVPDARIIVDRQVLGQTPVNSVKIENKTGKIYTIVIEKEGYKTYVGTLKKEEKASAQIAVVMGYVFSFFLFPMLLWINAKYLNGPVSYQYFTLEPVEQ